MEESNPGKKASKSGVSLKEKKENFSVRKRNPPKFRSRKNDVFINNKASLQAQLLKCQRLFDGGYAEIFIHGLGAAINIAVNVALILRERLSNTVDISVNTSTVSVHDDFFPLCDDEEAFTEKRTNSAVHIKVQRKPKF